MDFEPGQRVRCVYKGPWRSAFGPAATTRPGPAFGRVCKVAEILDGDFLEEMGWLTLDEFSPEIGFAARHFRPLSDGEFEKLRQACEAPPLRARDLVELLP
jgi:hypothetical protein